MTIRTSATLLHVKGSSSMGMMDIPCKKGHITAPSVSSTNAGEVNDALGHLGQDLRREETCTLLGIWSKAIPLQQKRNSS